jgi:hypothetical protein
MEPEGSLPHSQQPVTCPYPEHHSTKPRTGTISYQNSRNLKEWTKLCLVTKHIEMSEQQPEVLARSVHKKQDVQPFIGIQQISTKIFC